MSYISINYIIYTRLGINYVCLGPSIYWVNESDKLELKIAGDEKDFFYVRTH